MVEVIVIIVILIGVLVIALIIINSGGNRLSTLIQRGENSVEQVGRLPQEKYLYIPFTFEQIERIELHWSGTIAESVIITITEPDYIQTIFSELQSIQFLMDRRESEWFVGGSGNNYKVILKNGDIHRYSIWPSAEANPETSRVWVYEDEGWFFTTGTMLANASLIAEMGCDEKFLEEGFSAVE